MLVTGRSQLIVAAAAAELGVRQPASDRVALGRCRPTAPTDPYVLALQHTVPQPTDSPSTRDLEAISTDDVDMLRNRDVFRMFPRSSLLIDASLSSTGSSEASSPASTVLSKRYDILPSVPPHFVSFAWRYLAFHSFDSLPGGRVRHRGLELVTR